MKQRNTQNSNYIKKTNFSSINKKNKQQGKRQNKNNSANNQNKINNPYAQNNNNTINKINHNLNNIVDEQTNESLNSSLQAYINGNLNINTTNINQNIYNNNINPNNSDSDDIPSLNNNNIQSQFNQNISHKLNNNFNQNINQKMRINNNNISSYYESNQNNNNNQINYNQLLNLKNGNINYNNNNINNSNQILNNDLEQIKLKLLYLNALNNNNNHNINDVPNYANLINAQNRNMIIDQNILEQLRILKESNMKKQYLLNLLQIKNQIENNKKANLINLLINRNKINNGNNNLSYQSNNNIYNNVNQNNIMMNQNNNQNSLLINQLYRQLINNQILNQNQQNNQLQNLIDNNFNNNNINLNNNFIPNIFQTNFNQQYSNDNQDYINDNQNNNNIIFENFQNNQNQIRIQNNNSYNTNNRINNKINQNHNHISNSMNLYKLDNDTIIKEAYNLTKGQMGCRFLQKKIEDDTKFAKEFIYPIILQHLNEVIIDKFGNYLIQKFIDYLTQKELSEFLNNIKDNFVEIGLNQYGTRVIQKLITVIKNSGDEYTVNNYKTFISLIIPNVVKFSFDLNSCHIIQEIMTSKTFENKFLYEIYKKNIVEISNDKNGCCFLQKCIDKLSGKELNIILESILSNIKEIIIDKYGNYVVQYIIKNIITNNQKSHEIKNINLLEIFKFILDDFVNYSNQKYSSNVIEKLFMIEELKQDLIEKIKDPKIVRSLLFEKYGNYVIQKGLNFAEDNDREEIFKIIGDLLEELKKVEFGNKLLNKLMNKYPKLKDYLNKNNISKQDINYNYQVKDDKICINNINGTNDVNMVLNPDYKLKHNDINKLYKDKNNINVKYIDNYKSKK